MKGWIKLQGLLTAINFFSLFPYCHCLLVFRHNCNHFLLYLIFCILYLKVCAQKFATVILPFSFWNSNLGICQNLTWLYLQVLILRPVLLFLDPFLFFQWGRSKQSFKEGASTFLCRSKSMCRLINNIKFFLVRIGHFFTELIK
jgi:hypothetical protein